MATRSCRAADMLFALFISSAAAQYNASSTAPYPTGVANATSTNATVPAFSSVASILSSMSQQASALASIPAIAIPADHNKSDDFVSMVAAMPPVPVASGGPTFEQLNEMFGSYLAAPNGLNSTQSSSISGRQSGQRVMICGDSMTQGAEGDWTWRYRIWQWAQANDLNWQFVGPYTGTQDSAKPGPPQPPPLYGSTSSSGPLTVRNSGGYAADVSGAFLQDGGYNHFAVWGRAVAFDISTPPGQSVSWIQGMVQQYQPDILLVMLGFNDVGWFYSDGAGLLVNMGTFISQARAANPNIAIALANVPQRSWLGRQDLVDKTTYYDDRIGSYVDSWTTDQSPIRLVPLRETYSCDVSACPAGYDGLHPDSLGDYEIARAFSLTLSQFANVFKLSGNPQPLAMPNPVPLRPLHTPGSLQIVASPQGVTATWEHVYGSYGYRIQTKAGDGPWMNGTTQANRWDSTWAFANVTYQIQVAATAGEYDYLNTDFSLPESAVAQPQVPSPPQNVYTAPYGSDGMFVEWSQPANQGGSSISEYNVIIWDLDTDCAFLGGAAFQHSPAIITGLNQGHRYFIAPTAWNDGGPSFPNIGHKVRIGANTPATPSTPVLQPISDGQLHITWEGDSIAAAYTVFGRNMNENDGSDPFGAFASDPTCFDTGLLFPGYWNYEWCVQAYNGDFTSGNSTCVSLPQESSYTPSSMCPAVPGWCPGYGKGTTPTGEDGQGENGGTVGDGGGEGGQGPSNGGSGSATTTTFPYQTTIVATPDTTDYSSSDQAFLAAVENSPAPPWGSRQLSIREAEDYANQIVAASNFTARIVNCDSTQTTAILNAFVDMYTLGIYTYQNFTKPISLYEDYFGPAYGDIFNTTQLYIYQMYTRLVNGTYYENGNPPTSRTYDVSCVDTYKKCTPGKGGYVLDPETLNNPTENWRVTLCDQFFQEDRTKDRTDMVDAGENPEVFPPDDPRSFYYTQGWILFHELLHTQSVGRGVPRGPGLTFPKAKDRPVNIYLGHERQTGLAYTCPRAKYLARINDGELRGAQYAFKNNDNIVCFAFARRQYLMTGEVPVLPPAYWTPKKTSKMRSRQADDTDDTDGLDRWEGDEPYEETELIQFSDNMDIYTDEQFYGHLPCQTDDDCSEVCPPYMSGSCGGDPLQCLCSNNGPQPASPPPATIGAADCVGNPVNADGYNQAVQRLDTSDGATCTNINSNPKSLGTDCVEGAYVLVYDIADGVQPLCSDVIAAAQSILQSCTGETDQGGELVNGNVGVNNQYHVGVGSCSS